MAYSTVKAILGTCLVAVAAHGAEVTPLEKVLELLDRLSNKVEQEGKEEAATYDKYACYCKENADNELALQKKLTESLAKLNADIKELTTEIAILNGKDGVAGLNQKISKLEADVKAGQALRKKAHDEYMIKARDLDEAIAACANAIDSLENAKSSMTGAKIDFTQLTNLQTVVARQPIVTEEYLRLLGLADSGPGAALAYASQSNNILALLENLQKTYIKMKGDLDSKEAATKFSWEKKRQALENEAKFSEEDRDEKAQMAETKDQELSDTKLRRDDDKDDFDDSKTFLKDLTLNCEQAAKTFHANSDTRMKELTAISQAVAVLKDGSAAKTDSKQQKMISELQTGSKRKGALSLRLHNAAIDDRTVARAPSHDRSSSAKLSSPPLAPHAKTPLAPLAQQSMPPPLVHAQAHNVEDRTKESFSKSATAKNCETDASQHNIPGAGIVPFKPFVKVYKTGFMPATCVKDYLFYHGDKFGDNRFSYKLGPVSNVSIVHYEAHVAREDRKDMSPKVCFEFCRTIPHMNVFGIFNGRQCYCAPYYKAMAGDSTGCNQGCEGDPSSMCGSSSKSSVFTMHSCASKPAAPSPAPLSSKPSSFLQVHNIRRQLTDGNVAIKRTRRFLADNGHPRLNLLAIKMELMGDNFVQVRGLIKDLLTKLQKEAKAEATQKAFCDKGMKKAINDRDDAMSKIEASSAKISSLTAAINSLRQDTSDLNKQIAAMMKELNEATELRNDRMRENKEAISTAAQAAQDVKTALQILTKVALVQTNNSYILQKSYRSGKSIDVYALERDHKPKLRNQGIMGILEVIHADFDRVRVKISATENAEQADFNKLTKDSQNKVGSMKKKIKTNDADVKDKTTDLLGQKQALKDGKSVLNGAEKKLDSLKATCVGGVNYKKDSDARLSEVEDLREALKILRAYEREG